MRLSRASGEHRLPACSSRQLAANISATLRVNALLYRRASCPAEQAGSLCSPEKKTPLLNSAAFPEQIVNQLHSLSFRSARTKLRDAPSHSPRPIRTSCRAGDVEAVVPRQQIRDHDDGNPGVALEKRFHDGWIKSFFKIDLIEIWIKAGEQGDFCQIESRLLRRSGWPLESLLP